MRKTLLFFIAAVIASTLMMSCNQDSHVIPAGKMEDILYDYHLADAMAQQAEGGYEKMRMNTGQLY